MQGNPTSRLNQRTVVLQLLRKDRPAGWSLEELEHEVAPFDPPAISDALALLTREGVVLFTGEQVQASRCARHLDKLDLIGV